MSLLSIQPRKYWRNQQRDSRRRQFSQRRPGKALGVWLLLLGAVLSLACGIFVLAPAGSHLAAMPVTPLSDLPQHAGTGKIVRVQARLVSDPVVIGPEGQPLALQRLQVAVVSSDETPDATAPDATAEIAYDETVPGMLWVSDGEGAVAVDPVDFDPNFVHEIAAAEVEEQDVWPSVIRVKLSPAFDDVPAPAGAVMRLWHIEQGANVTIIGMVSQEEGQPILQAPAGGQSFIISPLPIEEIVERASSQSAGIRVLGWALVVLGVALGVASVISVRRSRRKHSPVE